MIPKMIHIIWIGPKPFPYQENYDSWVNLNPEFKVKLWTDMNIPTLHNKKAFGYMKSYAAKADILRLELLYRYGGIYADADSRCLRSIYPLISGLRCFGMTGNRGNVANGFLGSVKKHPAFEKLVYGLEGHIKNLLGKSKKSGAFTLLPEPDILPECSGPIIRLCKLIKVRVLEVGNMFVRVGR